MRTKFAVVAMAAILGIVGALGYSPRAFASYQGTYTTTYNAAGSYMPSWDGDGGCYQGYFCVWDGDFLSGNGVAFWGDEQNWSSPGVPRLPDGASLVNRGHSFVNWGYPGDYDNVVIFESGGFSVCLTDNSSVVQGWEGVPFYGHVWHWHC
jgi:hypothetical protein